MFIFNMSYLIKTKIQSKCVLTTTTTASDLHEEDSLVPGRLDQLLGIGGIHGQRLLTEHWLACLKHHHHRLIMLRMDGAHVYHIHLTNTNTCEILINLSFQPLALN